MANVLDIATETKQVEILNEIANNPSKTLRSKVYTANGTFVVPNGVAEVFLTGCGGGGGGGSAGNGNTIEMSGDSGGVTSFGSIFSLNGGGGADGPTRVSGASGGLGGGAGFAYSPTSGFQGGSGGDSYGRGGTGGSSGTSPSSRGKDGGYGGGGDCVRYYPVLVTPGSSISISIGRGGETGVSSILGGKGGNGILIINWWESVL